MAARCPRQGCWRNLGRKAALLAALLLTWDLGASAEDTTKIARIGVLASAEQHPIQSLKERGRELGWIEGKTSGSIPPKIFARVDELIE